jgi:predicted ATPase/class 3 adenylate cyclase
MEGGGALLRDPALPIDPDEGPLDRMGDNSVPMTESTVTPAPADARTELRTFLIADVRGYTRFTQERGNEAAARLVAKFAAITREHVRLHGGRLIELRGDEVLAVFSSARQALRAAVDLQAAFAAETEHDPTLPLPVGIGIDAGEAVPFEGGYRGEALNLAARLCNLAGPGEVLATEGVVYLGRRVENVAYSMRGAVPMKGFADPIRVIKVTRSDQPSADGADLLAADPESNLPIGGFLGALPSGELVGREREWEHIMSSLETVAQGSGRLLLLSGEPGIGKTRLAQEVTLKARHWGFLIATGRCYEPEQSVPFYGFLEILATLYNASPAFVRSEIPRRWPYLIRLLPDQLVDLPAGRDLPAAVLGEDGRALRNPGALDQADQQRLFRAVTGYLTLLAETMPLALLIDDLHWADDSTLTLLQHLARSTRGHRILLLGTYRDVEVHRQHPLEAVILSLGREGLLDEVEVRRLDQEGTAALMAEIMGQKEDLADLVELVYHRTDGNAFFIQEVMRALVERGDVYRHDGRWVRRAVREMEVPKSIRAAIGQRLSQLEEHAQDVLRAASVLGQEFTFDEVLMLVRLVPAREEAPWTEDQVEHAIEESVSAGLLRETGVDRYAFNHALTQQTLYAELSTRRRKRLHLAAGRALRELAPRRQHSPRERRAAELAWHFLEGDHAEQALGYTLLAGDQAEEVFANGDAERHYRTALELAQELDDREHELEALEKLAGVLTIVGRFDKAIELLERAARLHREAGNLEGEMCAVAQLGNVHFNRRTGDEGRERLKPLIDAQAGAPPSYGLAALWAAYARLYINSTMYEEQLAAADRAVELARAIGDHPQAGRLLIGAEITRGDALWRLGRQDETLRLMEDLIQRAESSDDIDNLTRALGNAARYYAWRGELAKDRAYNERMLEVAERRGDLAQTMLATVALSQNAFMVGDWELSGVYLERWEQIYRTAWSARFNVWPTAARAWLALRRGDREKARRLAEEVLTSGNYDYVLMAHRLLAEDELLASPAIGSPEAQRALAHLEAFRDHQAAVEDSTYLRTLAWAHSECGHAEEAAEFAAQGVARARADKSQPDLVEALVVHGMVMTRAGRWDEAEWDLAEARSLAQGMPLPFGEARALYEWGMLHTLRHEPDQARRQLEAARQIFATLDARIDLERTDAALNLVPASS